MAQNEVCQNSLCSVFVLLICFQYICSSVRDYYYEKGCFQTKLHRLGAAKFVFQLV
jgi:hypothetical protein